ncbi:FMN-linked oxidoreductase [Lojkania enalia]|uniref:FMN-linked oxidoreductase n=1 Tax=Lojkania enalia TaxID=147567 RepID=A0A9P4NAX2_9PLEO|nr:FMN-linked oxidoreductase [Didymosphaeria enalia]
MVDDRYLTAPGDVAVTGSDSDVVERWAAWTRAVRNTDSIMIAQLNHPGRQSRVGSGRRGFLSNTVAPSAIPLNLGDSWLAYLARVLLFGTPQAMTTDQIDNVIAQFARAAKLAWRAGFHGVEIHAAHGFLLSQFLSQTSNKRSDDFGGSATKRVEIVLRIIRAVRREVPRTFCVGIKINTADQLSPGGFDDMLQHVELIAFEQVDYIQLSGGSFEDPQMLSTRNSVSGANERTHAREGFFLDASHAIRKKLPHVVLMVTGGFRSRRGVNLALETGACDLIGIARPAVKYPELPNAIVFNSRLLDEEARFDVESAPSPGWIASQVRSVGAGAETKYFTTLLGRL